MLNSYSWLLGTSLVLRFTVADIKCIVALWLECCSDDDKSLTPLGISRQTGRNPYYIISLEGTVCYVGLILDSVEGFGLLCICFEFLGSALYSVVKWIFFFYKTAKEFNILWNVEKFCQEITYVEKPTKINNIDIIINL